MPPVNIPIAQTWPNGITTTNGVFWITADPSGIDDPQPINASIGIIFNSGIQETQNSFTVYLRGNENVPVSEGILNDQILSVINGYSLNNNNNLPPSIQTSESPNAFNIQATLQWGKFNGTLGYILYLKNSINTTIYEYNTLVSSSILGTTQLTNNTNYLFYIELNDDVIQASIYPTNAYGYLNNSIFTSSPIKDTSVFYRIPGHVGLSVSCVDPGAQVYSLYPYNTVFAEFKSNTFNSHTPVYGAQLYAQNTPPTQLFHGYFTTNSSSDNVVPILTTDSGRTLSGQSTKVIFGQSNATQIFQSIISSALTPIGDIVSGITDFTTLTASMDIWVESSALNSTTTPFIGALVNNQGVGLGWYLPTIVPNQWNTCKLGLTNEIIVENFNTLLGESIEVDPLIPRGLYYFAILYTGNSATTMWLDNIQITTDAISWSARSTTNNPFTQDLYPWIPFNNVINNINNGIRFDKPEYSLQVKADALQQDAEIYNGYTLVPNYAQLGRVVMNKTSPNIIPSSDISITADSDGDHEWTFICNITSDGAPIYNIAWSFGDGNYAYDQWIVGTPSVQRTYQYNPGSTTFGQYYVNVTVTDSNGNKGYANPTGTIS